MTAGTKTVFNFSSNGAVGKLLQDFSTLIIKVCANAVSTNLLQNVLVRPWWWLSGQRAHLLFLRSEFESRWSLHFYSVKCVFEKNEINKKRPGFAHLKINKKRPGFALFKMSCCELIKRLYITTHQNLIYVTYK